MDINDLKFQYKTSFACNISTLKSDYLESYASIENLKRIIPEFALTELYDLLPIAFNICTVNVGNLNGDLIDTEIGLQIYDKFNHRPVNIEHKRSECVGHIINGSLSSFSDSYEDGKGSLLLNPENVKGSYEPFNISLSAFIYKVVDPELIDLIIEASNPKSEDYLAISTSWELAFNDWDVLLGSDEISKGQRITDPIEKEKYKPFIKFYGGRGECNGKPVYRILKGDVMPLGIGLTANPAGTVQGIVTVTKNNKETNYKKDVNNKVMANNDIPELDSPNLKFDGPKNSETFTYVDRDKDKDTDNLDQRLYDDREQVNKELINKDQGENQDDKGLPANIKSKLSENIWGSPHSKLRTDLAKIEISDKNIKRLKPDDKIQQNNENGDNDVDKYSDLKTKVEVTKDTDLYDGTIALAKFKKFISHKKISHVKLNNKKNMRLDQITEADIKEMSIASFQSTLAEAIDEATKKYGDELDKAKKDADEKAAKAAAQKDQYESLHNEFSKIKAELDNEKKGRIKEKAQADFNSRMSSLSSKYDLSDKDCGVVAKQIKDMDDDAYADWEDGFSTIAAGKLKQVHPPIVTKDTDSIPDQKTTKVSDPKNALADKAEPAVVTLDAPDQKSKQVDPMDAIASIQDTLDTLKGKKPSIPNSPSSVEDAKARLRAAWDVKHLIQVGK